MERCIACDLMNGIAELPGGQIYTTDFWVVEHCIGPFGVGSLIIKPKRHCIHYWELTNEETYEIGPLLKLVSDVIQSILKADQVYICLWSHMNWKPCHIHFLLQPVWGNMVNEFPRNGAYLQIEMAKRKHFPDRDKVEEFVLKAKQRIQEIKE